MKALKMLIFKGSRVGAFGPYFDQKFHYLTTCFRNIEILSPYILLID